MSEVPEYVVESVLDKMYLSLEAIEGLPDADEPVYDLRQAILCVEYNGSSAGDIVLSATATVEKFVTSLDRDLLDAASHLAVAQARTAARKFAHYECGYFNDECNDEPDREEW